MPRASRFNPQAQADRLVLKNIGADALRQPWLSASLVLTCALVMGSIGAIVLARIAQGSHLVELALDSYAPVTWAAVFVLSLASSKPVIRRREQTANAGWLAALPQMPQAARRYSAALLWLNCLLQSMMLLGLLLLFSSRLDDPLAGFHWLLALIVPAGATLVAQFQPVASIVKADASRGHRLPRPGQPGDSIPAIVRQWQWLAFGQALWTPAVRWIIGGLLLLIPVGASAVAVGITLVVGWIVFQASNAWVVWMRTIVEASRLLRVLPDNTLMLLWACSIWPLILVGCSSLLLLAFLKLMGAAWSLAVLAMLVVQAVMLLALCCVLAWRHHQRHLQWRVASVVVLWLLLAQAMPPIAPLAWLVMVGLLLRRAMQR